MKFWKPKKPFKKNQNKKNSIWKNLYYWITHISSIKQIFIVYFFITLIGSFLLWASFSQQEGADVNFADALFTSASAFSDTGLVTKVTASTWSIFGQIVIAILILLGGVGFFALKVFLINYFLGIKTSLISRNVVSAERGTTSAGQTKDLIKISVRVILIVIIISSVALTLYFYFVPGNFEGSETQFNPQYNFTTSLRYGIFQSISAINNAGFDIIGTQSIQPYYYSYGIQFIFIFLFVLGGIGYPVIKDVFDFLKAKKKNKIFYFSLFTKISMTTYLIVVIIGLSLAFTFEISSNNVNSLWNNSNQKLYGSKWDRSMAIIFNTLSTRNAGFSTTNLNILSPTTKFLYSIMMFIGSAPASTAGGIRTTTLAVVVLSLFAALSGKKSTRVFNRRIKKSTVINALFVFIVSIILIAIGIFITYTSIDTNASQFNFIDVFFEVSSAFGTTGLSTGLTPQLNIAAKISLIFIMFIGQLGISTTIFVWARKKSQVNYYEFVEEDITIG